MHNDSRHIVCTVTNDLVYDQRMIRICTALADAGYQVTLVGRKKKLSSALTKRPFEQVRLEVPAEKGKLFYYQFHKALKKWLLAQKIDILYAVDLDTILACAKVSRKKSIPLVYDAHEYFTEVPELLGRPYVKAIWTKIADWSIPRADVCITVSQTLGDVLTQKYKKEFHVIRNVPTPKVVNKQPPRSPKIILYQGVLNKGRGLEASILAMHQIDQAQLWLVGMGDLEAALKHLVQVESLEDKVKFVGHVTPDKLVEITAQSWLGINLLEGESLNYFYSLANKFFDYMMAEIPSLNMNFPEYRTILSQHPMGLTLSELNPTIIADTINELLQSPATYTKMVLEAQQAKTTFNWDVEKDKLVDVIALVSRKKNRIK